MNKLAATKLTATICFAFMTFSLLLYLIAAWHFVSNARQLGIDDLQALKFTYFNDWALTPMYKYFIWPALLLYGALIYAFKFKFWLLGALFFILAIWLTVCALQEYYSVIGLKTVLMTGAALELIAICLYLLVLIKKESAEEARIES